MEWSGVDGEYEGKGAVLVPRRGGYIAIEGPLAMVDAGKDDDDDGC